jgi:hypothetical protein
LRHFGFLNMSSLRNHEFSIASSYVSSSASITSTGGFVQLGDYGNMAGTIKAAAGDSRINAGSSYFPGAITGNITDTGGSLEISAANNISGTITSNNSVLR